jgi:hypothetical protein
MKSALPITRGVKKTWIQSSTVRPIGKPATVDSPVHCSCSCPALTSHHHDRSRHGAQEPAGGAVAGPPARPALLPRPCLRCPLLLRGSRRRRAPSITKTFPSVLTPRSRSPPASPSSSVRARSSAASS